MPEAPPGGRWNPRCKFHYILKFNEATEESIERNFRSLSQRKRLCVALTALPVPIAYPVTWHCGSSILVPGYYVTARWAYGFCRRVIDRTFSSVNCVKYGVEAYLESFFFHKPK